jgi:hypothetical protein
MALLRHSAELAGSDRRQRTLLTETSLIWRRRIMRNATARNLFIRAPMYDKLELVEGLATD